MSNLISSTFVCSCCDEELPVDELSRSSLQLAHTNSPQVALISLAPEQLVCVSCEEIAESEPVTSLFEGQYSGVQLDTMTRQWLSLNY